MFLYQKNLKEGCGVVLDEILMVAGIYKVFSVGDKNVEDAKF